jgi:hypothetical protein
MLERFPMPLLSFTAHRKWIRFQPRTILKLVLLLLAASSSSSAFKVPISFACLWVHGCMGIPRHLSQLRTWNCSLASYQLQAIFLPSILLLLLPSTVFGLHLMSQLDKTEEI